METPIEYRPYGNFLRRGQVGFPRCEECGRFHWYPQSACPHCGSRSIVWRAAAGPARLFTWTVVHRKLDPDFSESSPYIVGLVEFDDVPGVRMVTNLIDTPHDQLRIGLHVEPVFSTPDDAGQPLVHFKVRMSAST